MPISINDLKERLTFKRYVYQTSTDVFDPNPKRTLKKTGVLWGAMIPAPLTSSFKYQAPAETRDTRFRIAEIYSAYVHEDPSLFDVVVWHNKKLHRLSPIQKEETFWRFLLGRFEEKEL